VFKADSFSNEKRSVTENVVEGPSGQMSPAVGKKRKTVPSKEEHEKTKEQKRQALNEALELRR
jgi:hypothetical protein